MINMVGNFHIVCFGPSDWWGNNPSCCTHIMRLLSEKNKIIYINPISSDLLSVRSRKGFAGRILRKIKSLFKFVRRENGNLYVASPVFIPVQGIRIMDSINNMLVRFQLRLLMFFVGIRRPMLWIENVRASDFIENFDWQMIIYHASDRFEECPYTYNKTKQGTRERYVSDKSDLIICVSQQIYESKQPSAKSYYLPHGVDFESFREAANSESKISSLSSISGPIAGYFGTLTAQNDIKLLEYCAGNLRDITFVFAGTITGGDYSRLASMSNVLFLGRVPYEEIAVLCASFDVCLLPWKMSKWIRSCNPLKLMEYMASGKPIVSVPIKEIVDNYSDVLTVADTKETFCRGIRHELDHDTEERKQKRIDIARQHSWTNHSKLLSELIITNLAKKQTTNRLCKA